MRKHIPAGRWFAVAQQRPTSRAASNGDSSATEPPTGTPGDNTTGHPSRAGRGNARLWSAAPWIAWALITAYIAYNALSAILGNPVVVGDTWFENGDAAGDALQARRALSDHWLITGHHTDVDVPHPGPFLLLIKAAAELIAPATNTPVLTITLGAYTLVKILTLSAGGALIAHAVRLPAAAPAAVAVILGGPWLLTMDPVGVSNPQMTAWFAIGFGGASLALACGHRYALVPLALFSGAISHAHTPSAPVGAAGLALVLITLIRKRRNRDVTWWTSAGISAAFLLPLLLRAALEFPWPLTYLTAAQNRMANVNGGNPRPRFDLLGEYLGYDGTLIMVFLGGIALAGVAFLLTRFSRGRRTGTSALVVLSGWAAVTAWISPPQQDWATELWWIAGVVAFFAASAAAVVLSGATHLLGLALRSTLTWARQVPVQSLTHTGLMLAVTVLLIPGSATAWTYAPSGATGTSYGSNPSAALEALTYASDGTFIVFSGGNDVLQGGYALLLAMQRNNVQHCVLIPPDQRNRGPLGLIIPDPLLCPPGTLERDDILLVSTDATGTRDWRSVIYRAPTIETDMGTIRGYTLGIPACLPERAPTDCPTG